MKNAVKKLFNDINMSWLKVILSSIIIGVYVGFILTVPALQNTSLTDIGATYEWWVLFAVIIVANCRKNYEAMLKCFVFFLISQPIIYLVQVALGCLSFEMAKMYYLNIWLPITLLTLPGGFVAYYINKENVFGGIILGIANTIEIVLGIMFTLLTVNNFPRHILSALFCFLSIPLMTFAVFKQKRQRIIAIVVPIVLGAAVILVAKLTGRVII